MDENKIIFEGFWDTLITKAKQGVLAVGGALGSGTAKGKLSVSQVSDAMYSKYKEYLAKTGSETNTDSMSDFLGRLGYSDTFVSNETSQFKQFLTVSDPFHPIGRVAPSGDQPDGASSTEPQSQTTSQDGKPSRKPFPNATPATAPTDTTQSRQLKDPKMRQAFADGKAAREKAATDAAAKQTADSANQPAPAPSADDQKIQAQKAMQQRMQQKKAEGPRARAKTRESLEESELFEKVSDTDLRKFFDTVAQRAFKSGEAKSAAQGTIASNRLSPAEPAQDGAAPQQGQAPVAQAQAAPQSSPVAQSQPAQAQPQAPTQTAPVTDTAAPEAKAGLSIPFTDSEKELMSAFPADTKLGPQVKATDPEVQALAQKVLQAAFDDFKRNNPSSAPKAAPAQPASAKPQRPARKPLPNATPATQAAPAQQAATPQQPAANQANPQAPAA